MSNISVWDTNSPFGLRKGILAPELVAYSGKLSTGVLLRQYSDHIRHAIDLPFYPLAYAQDATAVDKAVWPTHSFEPMASQQSALGLYPDSATLEFQQRQLSYMHHLRQNGQSKF